MANTYKPLSELAKALHGEDVFEAEFSATEERDHLDGGHLEIVPRPYEVLSTNYAPGKQGSTVNLSLLVEHEAALTQGGHIQRVSPAPTKKKG